MNEVESEIEEYVGVPADSPYTQRLRNVKYDKIGEVLLRKGSVLFTWDRVLLKLSGERVLYIYLVENLKEGNEIILDDTPSIDTPFDVVYLDPSYAFYEVCTSKSQAR